MLNWKLKKVFLEAITHHNYDEHIYEFKFKFKFVAQNEVTTVGRPRIATQFVSPLFR